MAQVIQNPKIANLQKKSGKPLEEGIVDSSFLMNMNYDFASQQLKITMKSGAEYVYSNVPTEVVNEFSRAPNKGEYYAKAIKGLYSSTNTVNKTVGKAVPQRVKK